MTEENIEPAQKSRDGIWWLTAGVATLVVALLVYLVVLIPTGTSLIPWAKKDSGASANALTSTGTVATLQQAINKELTAYYSFDYRTVDSAIATVIAGSTGKFKTWFQGLSVTVKEGVSQLKTTATSQVKQIAIHQLQGGKASALVVVTQTQSNTQTAKNKQTATCKAGTVCSTYHLWVTYQLVSGQWKLSNLEYWQ